MPVPRTYRSESFHRATRAWTDLESRERMRNALASYAPDQPRPRVAEFATFDRNVREAAIADQNIDTITDAFAEAEKADRSVAAAAAQRDARNPLDLIVDAIECSGTSASAPVPPSRERQAQPAEPKTPASARPSSHRLDKPVRSTPRRDPKRRDGRSKRRSPSKPPITPEQRVQRSGFDQPTSISHRRPGVLDASPDAVTPLQSAGKRNMPKMGLFLTPKTAPVQSPEMQRSLRQDVTPIPRTSVSQRARTVAQSSPSTQRVLASKSADKGVSKPPVARTASLASILNHDEPVLPHRQPSLARAPPPPPPKPSAPFAAAPPPTAAGPPVIEVPYDPVRVHAAYQPPPHRPSYPPPAQPNYPVTTYSPMQQRPVYEQPMPNIHLYHGHELAGPIHYSAPLPPPPGPVPYGSPYPYMPGPMGPIPAASPIPPPPPPPPPHMTPRTPMNQAHGGRPAFYEGPYYESRDRWGLRLQHPHHGYGPPPSGLMNEAESPARRASVVSSGAAPPPHHGLAPPPPPPPPPPLPPPSQLSYGARYYPYPPRRV